LSEKFKVGQLKDEQWDIVHSVVKERRDTILNAVTGFEKSLTFQILPFVHHANEQPGIVLIIMPLKYTHGMASDSYTCDV
jgi:superfamily II DNA helicase RecQ